MRLVSKKGIGVATLVEFYGMVPPGLLGAIVWLNVGWEEGLCLLQELELSKCSMVLGNFYIIERLRNLPPAHSSPNHPTLPTIPGVPKKGLVIFIFFAKALRHQINI